LAYVPEYVCAFGVQVWCFKSSLSISDWAAWVQAIGSIAALGVAIWVSKSGERAQRAEALLAAQAFVSGLVNCFRELKQAAAENSIPMTRGSRAQLEELVLIGRDVPLSRLPLKAVSAVLVLRTGAARTLPQIDETLRTNAFEGMPEYFEKRITETNAIVEKTLKVR
jgi:hypothetical protein